MRLINHPTLLKFVKSYKNIYATMKMYICDPSHQNRAVVGRMHFKILLHLYRKKQ